MVGSRLSASGTTPPREMCSADSVRPNSTGVGVRIKDLQDRAGAIL